MKTYIYADKFFLKSAVHGAGYLEIIDGKFGDIVNEVPEDAEVTDYSGQWIAPGLVDTHIHGFMNHDVMDNDAEGIKAMSEGLLSCGVTSFLPTTLTSSKERLRDVAETIGQVKDSVTGAKIQGIYFEGPFFTEEGVVVALGHSNGTLQEAEAAVEAGASVFVHAYNGMRGLNHREPGMVGALLSLKEVFSELICDGHHVHPQAAEILMEKAGHDHVALITDCMMAGGMPDGDYILGEFPVVVKDGTARLKEGNLAGSILKLKEAIKNVVEWEIATPQEAIMMASLVPAISCKIDDKCGMIKKGRAADFIVLDPQMNLQATFLDGVCRYEA